MYLSAMSLFQTQTLPLWYGHLAAVVKKKNLSGISSIFVSTKTRTPASFCYQQIESYRDRCLFVGLLYQGALTTDRLLRRFGSQTPYDKKTSEELVEMFMR